MDLEVLGADGEISSQVKGGVEREGDRIVAGGGGGCEDPLVGVPAEYWSCFALGPRFPTGTLNVQETFAAKHFEQDGTSASA